jgi:hypothetical protein
MRYDCIPAWCKLATLAMRAGTEKQQSPYENIYDEQITRTAVYNYIKPEPNNLYSRAVRRPTTTTRRRIH